MLADVGWGLRPRPERSAAVAVTLRPRQSNAPSGPDEPGGIASGADAAASWISLISNGSASTSAGQLQVKNNSQPRAGVSVTVGVTPIAGAVFEAAPKPLVTCTSHHRVAKVTMGSGCVPL